MITTTQRLVDAFARFLPKDEAELAAKAAPSINGSATGRDFDLLDLLTPENKYDRH